MTSGLWGVLKNFTFFSILLSLVCFSTLLAYKLFHVKGVECESIPENLP